MGLISVCYLTDFRPYWISGFPRLVVLLLLISKLTFAKTVTLVPFSFYEWMFVINIWLEKTK